jgi:8-oxo-dGTP pyrophosphatase MutT (NUDIX family)
MESVHMDQDLASYLSTLTPNATEYTEWRGGQIHLEIAAYCGVPSGPDHLVTSARALLLADREIVVLTNPGGDHILPGGRRKPGESLMQALEREVYEETGIRIASPRFIGIMHYHHLTPKPPLYEYPYPDFLNAIYAVQIEPGQELTVSDSYELSGRYLPSDEVAALALPRCQMAFLEHVLAPA